MFILLGLTIVPDIGVGQFLFYTGQKKIDIFYGNIFGSYNTYDYMHFLRVLLQTDVVSSTFSPRIQTVRKKQVSRPTRVLVSSRVVQLHQASLCIPF